MEDSGTNTTYPIRASTGRLTPTVAWLMGVMYGSPRGGTKKDPSPCFIVDDELDDLFSKIRGEFSSKERIFSRESFRAECKKLLDDVERSTSMNYRASRDSLGNIMRGIFDANGMASCNDKKDLRVTFAAPTPEIASSIYRMLAHCGLHPGDPGVNPPKLRTRSGGHMTNLPSVAIVDINEVISFYDWIYSQSTESTRLKRKFLGFSNILSELYGFYLVGAVNNLKSPSPRILAWHFGSEWSREARMNG